MEMAAMRMSPSSRNCSRKRMIRLSSSTGRGSQMPGSTRESNSPRSNSVKSRSGRMVKPSSLFTGSRPAEKVTVSLS